MSVKSDKGKPVERLGRKATGLMRAFVMTARLPELIQEAQNWVDVIGIRFVLFFARQIQENPTPTSISVATGQPGM